MAKVGRPTKQERAEEAKTYWKRSDVIVNLSKKQAQQILDDELWHINGGYEVFRVNNGETN